MSTLLSYAVSDFIPFTKIVSADVNSRFSDIKNRFNWAGGTDATTGLGDDNLQSITASGGGLTRATKLKAGTANAVIINNSTTGAMSEFVPGASKALYTDGSGILTSATSLPLAQGGTGSSLTIGNEQDTLQVINGVVAFGVPPVPSALRVYTFYRYS